MDDGVDGHANVERVAPLLVLFERCKRAPEKACAVIVVGWMMARRSPESTVGVVE